MCSFAVVGYAFLFWFVATLVYLAARALKRKK